MTKKVYQLAGVGHVTVTTQLTELRGHSWCLHHFWRKQCGDREVVSSGSV